MSRKIPVLVLGFNRADHVSKAMLAVREYRPDKLYLECDGPRENKSGEWEAVEATQNAMLGSVDWSCNVKTLFRKKNLGCANAVYGAISWFFENEEYGIIVEDDMVIGLDFFRLCEELLPRYANEYRIMTIQAMNTSYRTDIPNTYVYSYGSGCWGWASWRRAWNKMDMSMSALPKLSWFKMIRRFGVIQTMDLMRNYWAGYRHIDTFSSWAYRWSLSIQFNDGLSIKPGVNLAKNIGTDGGTHYNEYDIDPYNSLMIGHIKWPLIYNDTLKIDKKQFYYGIKGFYRLKWISIKKKIRQSFRMNTKYNA